MLRAFACALVVWAASARAQAPSVPEVEQRLRAIESASLKGQADGVRIDLQEQSRNRPGDVMLRVYVAWCGIPSDDSWNTLKGIATINPDNPWVHLGMGRIYARWKMKDQAEQSYRTALKPNPHFYPALIGLGDLARTAGNNDAAEKLYRDALALQDDGGAHGGLGLTLLAAGKAADARKELDRAYQLWPEQPEVLAALGRLSRDAKDPKAAEQFANRLIELAPKDREARRMLADLRLELGEKREAAQEYERVLRLGASDSDVLRRLGDIYRELGNGEGEEHALQQLAALDKQSVDPLVRLAELAEARGAMDETEGQLLEAIHRVASRADLLLRLARVQLKRDELKEARESYLAAAAGQGDKPPELQTELDALTTQLKLPKKPAKGSVDQIYGTVSSDLNALYAERLKQRPDLGGTLKLRTKVDDQGKAVEVEVAEDSVGDPVIAGHVYFALKDAEYPKHKREPLFEFELKPPRRK